MAQVKLLKIGTDGLNVEFDSASDEITLNGYTVQGGGPVLSGTGLAMNDKDVSGVQDLVFQNPTTGTINQTAGNLVIDNIVAKDRSNLLTTGADILFPTVSDTAGEVDILRLPAIAGAPSATPTATGEGFVLFDSTNDDLYVYNGTAWKNMSIASSAAALDEQYTAGEALSANDFVYISGADTVSKALATNASVNTKYAIGLAKASALNGAAVTVRTHGIQSGFTGLTAGSRYFLSTTAAGGYQNSIPTGAGNSIIQLFVAKSATQAQLNIQYLATRA